MTGTQIQKETCLRLCCGLEVQDFEVEESPECQIDNALRRWMLDQSSVVGEVLRLRTRLRAATRDLSGFTSRRLGSWNHSCDGTGSCKAFLICWEVDLAIAEGCQLHCRWHIHERRTPGLQAPTRSMPDTANRWRHVKVEMTPGMLTASF